MAYGATQTARATTRAARDAHDTLQEAIAARYTLLTEITQGALTVVYMALPRASAPSAGRFVALKCLRPELMLHLGDLQRLRHEAWVSSQVHHAHLTRCLDLVETAHSCCIVQNYVEGQDLSQLLHSQIGGAPERYIAPILVDVLEGLAALHTALDEQSWPLLLSHGAIRARHVLVGVDGIGRLTDFSHVKSRRGLLSRQGGSPSPQARYMAPEQARDPKSVDSRSDIFLAGVMLWEALTGQPLFAAENEELTLRHLMRRPVLPPSKAGCRPSAYFDEVCLRALHRDPGKRYDSALEMAYALRDAALNAGLYAGRNEIGEWVQSRSFAAHTSDEEPTARFASGLHSEMREIPR